MHQTMPNVEIQTDQPIPTWFNCGGKAKRFACPAAVDELKACLRLDRNLRVLGDGANLLVADAGVEELVVSLSQGELAEIKIDAESGVVSAGAGANLPKLLVETARVGLAGLETLAGIPASVGGAVVMNAGGAFGQTGDCIHAVHGVDRLGHDVTLKRTQIHFNYRHADFHGIKGLIITRVDFRLRQHPGGAEGVRAKLKEVMEYKKRTQPMAEDSAGCCFKNPTLMKDLPGVAVAGTRVSAGMLIDQAGCKGLRIGGAEVSSQHANFFVAHDGCTAADVIALMRSVREKVKAKFGVVIEPEVVVWGAEV